MVQDSLVSVVKCGDLLAVKIITSCWLVVNNYYIMLVSGCFFTLQDDPPQNLMLKPLLSLKWRRGKDMPIKMSSTVQSVVIEDFVYVGGGHADSDYDSCTVMKLDLQQDTEWTKLPLYSTMLFAMTSYDNQLVLVGGCIPLIRKKTNQIAVFSSGTWTSPYLPMIIARHSSRAVCFNNHIIVTGGSVHQFELTPLWRCWT